MPAVAMLLLSAAVLTASPVDRRATSPDVHIAIEQEPGVSLAEDEIQAIAGEIERIWRPSADVVATTGNGPAGMLSAHHVRLVLTTRTLPMTDTAGIGWIEFIDGEPQPVLTVSLAAVDRLLAAGAWSGRPFSSLPAKASLLFRRRAVARAAAHELGHYLLRTKDHARHGLMRAVYSVDEIMSGSTKHNRIEPKLLATLQRGGPDRVAERRHPLSTNE